MTLARRLLLGSLVVVLLLVSAVVLVAGARLRERLVDDRIEELGRNARLVAIQWTPGVDPDSLAHRAGAALGYRVTLIDSTGVVRGDADFTPEARLRLQNHATRPEVMAARREGTGSARRRSASAGDEELYVAVRHPLGVVRVAITTRRLDEIVGGAQHDVVTSGLLGLAGALVLAWFFARSVSRPVVELRDVARAMAAGDLARRPALSAPGEVGDLATALHRMAEQLRARLEALEGDDLLMVAVLESLDEGVLAIDARGTVARLNSRARVLLGVLSPAPFSRDLLPRDGVLREAIDAALSGEPASPMETRLGGRTVTVGARPLAMGGAVVTILDLTVVRRLETIRRDFVANVSHELKTPLTAVSGYAETLLDEGIPAPQRNAFIRTIRDNAGRMQRIVDDLLDLSRIESGGWRPRVATFDAREMLQECLTAVRAEGAAKGLVLRAAIPDDAVAHADPTAFRQVVANLLENAVRYTAAGEVALAAREVASGLWIDVSDTGVGIAAEHLPRIFERFYRVDTGRSREQGGTGLGLAIVRHLVEAHGGRVEAKSVVGLGTTISVYFPGDGGDG